MPPALLVGTTGTVATIGTPRPIGSIPMVARADPVSPLATIIPPTVTALTIRAIGPPRTITAIRPITPRPPWTAAVASPTSWRALLHDGLE
jgi:hypothetical protein